MPFQSQRGGRARRRPFRAGEIRPGTSLRIWPGSSVRGLLSVKITRSAPVSATAASRRRSVRSLQPSLLKNAVNAARGDRSQGGQGFIEAPRRSGPRRPGHRSPDLQNRFEMPWDGCIDSSPAATADRSIPRPHASAAAAKSRCCRPRTDQRQVHGDFAVEAVQQHTCARAVHPLELSRDVNRCLALATGSSAKATRRASRFTPPRFQHSGRRRSRPPIPPD